MRPDDYIRARTTEPVRPNRLRLVQRAPKPSSLSPRMRSTQPRWTCEPKQISAAPQHSRNFEEPALSTEKHMNELLDWLRLQKGGVRTYTQFCQKALALRRPGAASCRSCWTFRGRLRWRATLPRCCGARSQPADPACRKGRASELRWPAGTGRPPQ